MSPSQKKTKNNNTANKQNNYKLMTATTLMSKSDESKKV